MAKMSAAAPAMHFGAFHPETPVGFGAHRTFDRTPETRPAGSAIELGLRLEECQFAGGADEDALAMLVKQRAAACSFRGLMPKHLILSRRKQAPPFLVCLCHLDLLRFGQEPSRKDDLCNRGRCQHHQ